MNNQELITNLENQMTEVIKCMNLISNKDKSIEGIKGEYYFSPYKDYICIFKEVLNTYAKINSSIRDKRLFVENIKELISNELTLILGLSNLVISSNVKQYKCLTYCTTALVLILQQIGHEFKGIECKNCKHSRKYFDKGLDECRYTCGMLHKDLIIEDKNIIKLEECTE